MGLISEDVSRYPIMIADCRFICLYQKLGRQYLKSCWIRHVSYQQFAVAEMPMLKGLGKRGGAVIIDQPSFDQIPLHLSGLIDVIRHQTE